MVGALAIAGLPPLNGFVSEWLMYLGLLKGGLVFSADGSLTALLAVGLLALVGGLAAICFVRLAGIVLLGNARSAAVAHAHEAPPAMILPMAVLALFCVGAAIFPAWL